MLCQAAMGNFHIWLEQDFLPFQAQTVNKLVQCFHNVAFIENCLNPVTICSFEKLRQKSKWCEIQPPYCRTHSSTLGAYTFCEPCILQSWPKITNRKVIGHFSIDVWNRSRWNDFDRCIPGTIQIRRTILSCHSYLRVIWLVINLYCRVWGRLRMVMWLIITS